MTEFRDQYPSGHPLRELGREWDNNVSSRLREVSDRFTYRRLVSSLGPSKFEIELIPSEHPPPAFVSFRIRARNAMRGEFHSPFDCAEALGIAWELLGLLTLEVPHICWHVETLRVTAREYRRHLEHHPDLLRPDDELCDKAESWRPRYVLVYPVERVLIHDSDIAIAMCARSIGVPPFPLPNISPLGVDLQFNPYEPGSINPGRTPYPLVCRFNRLLWRTRALSLSIFGPEGLKPLWLSSPLEDLPEGHILPSAIRLVLPSGREPLERPDTSLPPWVKKTSGLDSMWLIGAFEAGLTTDLGGRFEVTHRTIDRFTDSQGVLQTRVTLYFVQRAFTPVVMLRTRAASDWPPWPAFFPENNPAPRS